VRSQPAYASLRFVALDPTSWRDTYLDTDSWAVWRGGFSLAMRHRADGAEVALEALAGREGDAGTEDLNAYSQDETAAGSVSERVKLLAGGAALHTVLEMETKRSPFSVVREDEEVARLYLDASTVHMGEGETVALHRVEVEETVAGGLVHLGPFLQAMEAACALETVSHSRFEAALALRQVEPASTLDFGYAELSPDATTGEYAYAILRRYFTSFLRHEPGTRLGEDAEELHDMRVATRRMRAAMSIFKTALPPRFETLREELKWIAAALGEVRDLDVQLEWLAAQREDADWRDSTAVGPLVEDIVTSRVAARRELLEAMASERYTDLLDAMMTALRLGDEGIGDAATPVRRHAIEVLRKRYRKFHRPGAKLKRASPAEEFHAVRIAAKRLRYSLDSFLPVFVRRQRAQRMVEAMKDVQDLLGQHQDCAVAIDRLRSLVDAKGASLPPPTLFRMGELVEQCRGRMADIRGDWRDALDEVEDAWGRLKATFDDIEEPEAEGGDEEDAAEVQARAPVQRPFGLLQRFFSRRDDD
jgi:CHAD domain-containing protein